MMTTRRLCKKCRMHGVERSYSGHARYCPYITCDCEKCTQVEVHRKRIRGFVNNLNRRKMNERRQQVLSPSTSPSTSLSSQGSPQESVTSHSMELQSPSSSRGLTNSVDQKSYILPLIEPGADLQPWPRDVKIPGDAGHCSNLKQTDVMSNSTIDSSESWHIVPIIPIPVETLFPGGKLEVVESFLIDPSLLNQSSINNNNRSKLEYQIY